MANYGIEIWRQDGSFFASPDYTPMVLCHVIDFSINVANWHGVAVATNIPAGMNALVFYRAMANAAPGLPLYLSENGAINGCIVPLMLIPLQEYGVIRYIFFLIWLPH